MLYEVITSRPDAPLNIAVHRVPSACQLAIALACLGSIVLFFEADALFRIARLLLPGGAHAG